MTTEALNKKWVVSWDEFHKDVVEFSETIKGEGNWKGIAAITRGGLIPTSLLAHQLRIYLIDTICIKSYTENREEKDTTLEIIKQMAGDGTDWLIVDDLVDTGVTAKVVKELLPKAKIAVIYAKPQGLPYTDYYFKETAQETWIDFPWENYNSN